MKRKKIPSRIVLGAPGVRLFAEELGEAQRQPGWMDPWNYPQDIHPPMLNDEGARELGRTQDTIYYTDPRENLAAQLEWKRISRLKRTDEEKRQMAEAYCSQLAP